MSNLEIWDTLGKTDPKATKQFSRSGGFKGTAIKPQWAFKQLTEQFGPVGIGWGMNRPEFRLEHHGTEGEVLVYCIAECWHTDRANIFFGVGGDKVIAKNKNGMFADDEAFKKAHTDAVMNAFKLVGVGADIHMGQFDDDKYVASMEREFAEPATPPATITEEQRVELVNLFELTGVAVGPVLKRAGETAGREIANLGELPAAEFGPLKQFLSSKPAKQKAA